MAKKRLAAASNAWADLPAGTRVVVDSAPIIYVLEDHPQFAPRFVGLFEAEAAGSLEILISAITLSEVLTGPFQAGQEALAQRYATALQAYTVIPVDNEIAVSAARLRSRYRLKLPDAIQPATVLESGAHGLVTNDIDFSVVEGITLMLGES